MASTISAGTTTTTSLVYTADTSGVLQLQTNGTTTAVTIDTAQNVGIGTTSPSTKLNIVQNQNGASQVLLSNNTGGASSQVLFSATDGTNYGQFGMWGSGVSASGAQQPSNAFVYGSGGISYFTGGTHRWYYSTNTEAMRIDNSGNLLVGTTNNVSSARVNVAQGSSDGVMYQMMQFTGGSGTGGNEIGQMKRQTTASVSNSATTIESSLTFGELITVTGVGSGAIFADLLMASYNTVAVISSNTQQGSPASRTYSISSGALRLTMGSSTSMAITVQSLICGARGA